MLDKLIISKTGAENNRTLRGLLVSTSVIVMSLLTFGLVFSLFSQNLAMGQDDLNISTLIAAPIIPHSVPPQPEPREKSKVSRNDDRVSKVITRKFNMQRADESPAKVPDAISTKPSQYKSRPDTSFLLGKIDQGEKIRSSAGERTCTKNCGDGSGISDRRTETVSDSKVAVTLDKTLPKPPPIKIAPKAPISGGVLNGKAVYLSQPAYPASAKSIGASGKVVIAVLIDETGKVVSANVTEGHPLLRASAEKAARSSRFSPTKLSNVPVEVTGIIVYNFIP